MTATLVLADGTIFHGQAFGAATTVVGEVVFNTSLTGYQEVITDPSYRGQMVCMTVPHVGNTGVNPEDVESDQPQITAFIVREVSPVVSNWRANETLTGYLARTRHPRHQRGGYACADAPPARQGRAPRRAVHRRQPYAGSTAGDGAGMGRAGRP